MVTTASPLHRTTLGTDAFAWTVLKDLTNGSSALRRVYHLVTEDEELNTYHHFMAWIYDP